MSGITTTPHVHFQIDKADAPFHPYWPYTFKDLRDLKLDFFDAVNVGLGKENAMKYTVSPLDFVQSLENGVSPPPPTVPVSAVTPTTPQTFVAAVVVAPPVAVSVPNPAIQEPLLSAPKLPNVVVSSPLVSLNSSAGQAANATQAYLDVPARATYAKAVQYLKERSVSAIANETVFRPTQALTRREAVLYLAGVFGIESQMGVTSPFADVPSDDAAIGYITTLQARGVIQSGWLFRPNDAITKAELVALMLRITGDYQESITQFGKDGAIQEFVRTTSYSRVRLQPNKAVTRADAAKMMQLWGTMGRG